MNITHEEAMDIIAGPCHIRPFGWDRQVNESFLIYLFQGRRDKVAETWQQELQEKFDSVDQGETIRKLMASEENNTAQFLEILGLRLDGVSEPSDIWEDFLDLSEQSICGGQSVRPEYDLVRVVSIFNFLFYYSQKFIGIERDLHNDWIIAEIEKITNIAKQVDSSNLRTFLDVVLNLNGRLRRREYPLWFSTVHAVRNCSSLEDYAQALSLGDDVDGPLFCFETKLDHIGSAPNVRQGERDHNPNDTMTIHIPTAIDGMFYSGFVHGGETQGGAVEYVSRIDNSDIIDHMEIVA